MGLTVAFLATHAAREDPPPPTVAVGIERKVYGFIVREGKGVLLMGLVLQDEVRKLVATEVQTRGLGGLFCSSSSFCISTKHFTAAQLAFLLTERI